MNIDKEMQALKDLARYSKEHVGVFGYVDARRAFYNSLRVNPVFLMGGLRMLEVILSDRYYFNRFWPTELYTANKNKLPADMHGLVGYIDYHIPKIPVYVHKPTDDFDTGDLVYAYRREPFGVVHEEINLQASN